MKEFQAFLDNVNPNQRERLEKILRYVKESFPNLKEEIKWNQPMFTDHGTFIIAFSVAKEHISVAPEGQTLALFEADIAKAGYSYTKELFRIRLKDEINFDLLHKIVAYKIEDKKDCKSFWKK